MTDFAVVGTTNNTDRIYICRSLIQQYAQHTQCDRVYITDNLDTWEKPITASLHCSSLTNFTGAIGG